MFSHLPELPPDPIYGMQEDFKNDERPEKINLSIGVLLNAFGKLQTMQAVLPALRLILTKNSTRNYLPITGHPDFCKASQDLVCGSDVDSEELFTTQSVGGTGGLYILAKLLSVSGIENVFISDPSWPNHRGLFQAAGLKVSNYPYYNKEKGDLKFEALIDFIPTIPPKSAIIFQASCHNPTGVDPTASEWATLSQVVKRKNIIPIFDLAYLGLGNGLKEDVQGIHKFLEDGHELFVVTTYSKTFGLYNDRIGSLTVRAKKETLPAIASQIRAIIRACYSSPPAMGARIVKNILADGTMKALWQQELEEISARLKTQRKLLYDALKRQSFKLPFEHVLSTHGLFCLFDLSKEQVLKLQKEHGIYLALDGRISLASINDKNVDTVAKAIAAL